MKKKTLLLTLLALAIITSISAGTLAVYTKNVTLGAAVEIKKFAFDAAGSIDGGTNVINLAPKEAKKYTFTVNNFLKEDGAPAEVALDYEVAIDFSDAAGKMPGLTAELFKDDDKKPVETAVDGKIKYRNSTPENVATTHKYVLTLTWAGGSDADHYTAGTAADLTTKGLSVIVNASQKLASN